MMHLHSCRAIPTYDEMPRTAWIFKYSAQNTVTVSRTFFTQEVTEAFDELEEGNEEALKNEFERQVRKTAAGVYRPVLQWRGTCMCEYPCCTCCHATHAHAGLILGSALDLCPCGHAFSSYRCSSWLG
jgi:hypothetical protein